jgi:acyl-CoA synthetase (AMP-forming)/AMP-acid ligase II
MMVDNAMEILRREDCAGCDISSLKFVKTASFVNRITPELREAWRRRTGASLHEVSWGMTETHTYDFFTSGFQGDNRDLQYEGVFVGLPVPGTEVKICDFDTGVILAEGKSGEIVVRSPSVTRAYLEAGGTAVSALDEGGWFHTGDIGVVHSDGTMSYLGRSKELIKVKGMSVYPSELEVIIAQHPAVSQVAVVPRADPVYGQVPVAFVTFMSGSRTTREELAEWARGQFASYKQPEFRVIDVFPATFSGKIKKRELVSTYLPQEDK